MGLEFKLLNQLEKKIQVDKELEGKSPGWEDFVTSVRVGSTLPSWSAFSLQLTQCRERENWTSKKSTTHAQSR